MSNGSLKMWGERWTGSRSWESAWIGMTAAAAMQCLETFHLLFCLQSSRSSAYNTCRRVPLPLLTSGGIVHVVSKVFPGV